MRSLMKKRDYLVWSILTTLFCCLPFGVVSIIYATKANSAYDAGNFDEHTKCADKAKMWMILGAVIGFIVSVVWIGINVAGALAAASLEASGAY